ncbi:MAG: tRNA (N6-threonylcarbamoyladenosine(37)-N6)-methyltransferase TrmO [Candidatus Kapaibacteriota bacterium]
MESALQTYSFEPIGIVSSRFRSKYDAPHQGNYERQPAESNSDHAGSVSNQAALQLFPHRNFEQALADIQGFERLWVLYLFHENLREGASHWKPKVLPPRGRVKRGVFATRAPYRPNPLGISVVRVLSVQGLVLRVGDCDLLDGTPILDIKPYIPLYDSFPDSRTGWLEELDDQPFTCEFSPEASLELALVANEHPTLEETLRRVLALDPFPHPYRRIRRLDADKGLYEYAYKTWRISYCIDQERRHILITSLVNAAK